MIFFFNFSVGKLNLFLFLLLAVLGLTTMEVLGQRCFGRLVSYLGILIDVLCRYKVTLFHHYGIYPVPFSLSSEVQFLILMSYGPFNALHMLFPTKYTVSLQKLITLSYWCSLRIGTQQHVDQSLCAIAPRSLLGFTDCVVAHSPLHPFPNFPYHFIK